MSVFSIIALITSILGSLLYASIFSISGTTILFIIVAIISIILPPISKAKRIKEAKKGVVLEIIAIIVGGFNFYCVIFALTSLPIFIGYLGWIVCAIVYKTIR